MPTTTPEIAGLTSTHPLMHEIVEGLTSQQSQDPDIDDEDALREAALQSMHQVRQRCPPSHGSRDLITPPILCAGVASGTRSSPCLEDLRVECGEDGGGNRHPENCETRLGFGTQITTLLSLSDLLPGTSPEELEKLSREQQQYLLNLCKGNQEALDATLEFLTLKWRSNNFPTSGQRSRTPPLIRVQNKRHVSRPQPTLSISAQYEINRSRTYQLLTGDQVHTDRDIHPQVAHHHSPLMTRRQQIPVSNDFYTEAQHPI